MAAGRLSRLSGHLGSGSGLGGVGGGGSDDVLVVSAVRTPICRARRGGLRGATPDVLLSTALRAVVARSRVPVERVGDVVVGNVWGSGAGADLARIAMFLAGFPYSVPVTAVNRQCASGLQSVANVAAAIRAGLYDCGIAAGVESMTHNPHQPPTAAWEVVSETPLAQEALTSMGATSDTVAQRYGVSREKQDAYALESHRRAADARRKGLFREEIEPVSVTDPDTGAASLVEHDDGIREDTTMEKLARLKPAFSPEGTTTAGNASQVSDGAAAVLLMRRSAYEALCAEAAAAHTPPPAAPLGKCCSFAVVGVKPDEMGVGPVFAVPRALEMAGIAAGDVDCFEINEAFASQYAYCVETLALDPKKVNPLGGAIALGHPLGMTGCRQVATLLHHLKRTKAKTGVVSMCIGTGMGAAAVFQAE